MADSPVDENRVNRSTGNNKRPAPSPSSTASLSSVPKKQKGAASSSIAGGSGSGSSASTGPANNNNSSSSNNNKLLGASPSSSAAGEKSSRGLRHFSMMVCKKVEEKGTTTYNEVADELVRQVVADRQREDPAGKFDEKNIRRRVYDALNVLMAMDIIYKEKKDISWRGLPAAGSTTAANAAGRDLDGLRKEAEYRAYQLDQKREALREALVQQVCFRNLVQRNQRRGPPEEKIPLPFIVVNTNSEAVIHCNMSRDRTDVMFDFSMPFEINDDNTILKRMGM
jgi:hypothetical protein